jgi:hypothetical protein
MNPGDPDRELARLKQASERIAANLVELEIDSSRRLLEASTLTGESAENWAGASAALTELWTWRDCLDELLEQADKLRHSPRRADELHELLTGPSIELQRSTVPLAERNLLAGPELAVRCTPEELLVRMSRAFDQVKTVVARFGAAWEVLAPRLADARASLDRAEGLAASLGETDRSELQDARVRTTELGQTLTADPLVITPRDVDRLIDSLRAIERDLEAAVELRRELDPQLSDARARLARLTALVQECRDAHEELVVKISPPTAAGPPAPPQHLSGELDQIAAYARSGDWREASRRLAAWSERVGALHDEVEGCLRANRAPLEARNQLRALLEAYQVKAARLGAIEDPELERIFTQAHAALYTAPTDLSVAAQLVCRYQELLNAPRSAKEVIK